MVGGHLQEMSLRDFFYKVVIGGVPFSLTTQLKQDNVMCVKK